MSTKAISLRVDEELLDWADTYAKGRGVTRTELFESALADFREDCVQGVPDLRRRLRAVRDAQAPKPGECSCPNFGNGVGFSNKCPVHGLKSREDFNRATNARGELFRGLTAPESVRFGVKKEGRS